MNQLQHVDIKFNHDEIRGLQQEDPNHSKIIKYMKMSNRVAEILVKILKEDYIRKQ